MVVRSGAAGSRAGALAVLCVLVSCGGQPLVDGTERETEVSPDASVLPDARSSTNANTNACGGSGPLTGRGGEQPPGEPGDPCGPCGDGVVFCASPNIVACIGGGASSTCAAHADASAPDAGSPDGWAPGSEGWQDAASLDAAPDGSLVDAAVTVDAADSAPDAAIADASTTLDATDDAVDASTADATDVAVDASAKDAAAEAAPACPDAAGVDAASVDATADDAADVDAATDATSGDDASTDDASSTDDSSTDAAACDDATVSDGASCATWDDASDDALPPDGN